MKSHIFKALVISGLLGLTGCISEQHHSEEMQRQTSRYENEINRQQTWFFIILLANNAAWFLAYRKKP